MGVVFIVIVFFTAGQHCMGWSGTALSGPTDSMLVFILQSSCLYCLFHCKAYHQAVQSYECVCVCVFVCVFVCVCVCVYVRAI